MRKHLIRSVAICILLLSVVAFSLPQNDKYFEIVKNLDIFATLYKEVNANYVDDINPNLIIETGIDAMLSSLDPYTVYYAEDEIEDVRTKNTGQYGGIGARIGERLDGGVYVLMVDEGLAADKAGLKRGDEIIQVAGQSVANDYDRASEFLKGQAGSQVALTVRRPFVGEIELELSYEKIKLANVPYAGMVTSQIGLVKLAGFRQNASKEVKSAIRDLKKKGADHIILDLRGNGGGLLAEAVNVSNLFIDKDELIVTTKGKLEEMNASYKTLNASYDTEIPLVVLIDRSSASASEIVAGVMQDYDRGVLIGQKSFGKGLVQRTMPLSYNSQLKVTIAKYYTPSGRCIQALDYANRNEDGSVGVIADSLKTQFKTANGRLVFDGGGVDPDWPTERRAFSPLTISLLAQDLFFQFANEYDHDWGELYSGQEVIITDKIYDDFKVWLSDKSIGYSSDVIKQLELLRLTADQQGQLDEIADEIDRIDDAVKKDLESDIEKAKKEILFLLREEFAGRFFYEKGQLEASFLDDADVQKAVEVLNDPEIYQATLVGR
jgi:carboxyl-terminal processing protease